MLNQPRSPSTEEVEFKDSGNEVVSQTTAIIHTSPQSLGNETIGITWKFSHE